MIEKLNSGNRLQQIQHQGEKNLNPSKEISLVAVETESTAEQSLE